MNPLDYSVAFTLGLMSSLHCVQMCGPIVLSYSVPLAAGGLSRAKLLEAHAAYNSGRILTYAALGAAAGAAGKAIGMLGALAGVANGARIFAGIAMVAAAVLLSGLLGAGRLVRLENPGALARLAGRVRGLLLAPRPRSKFGLGLLFGFLPCGLVYAALLKALETGSAGGGALSMAAFGLGTALALAAIGVASSWAGLRAGKWSNLVAAAAVAAVGLLLLFRGVTAPPPSHAHHG